MNLTKAVKEKYKKPLASCTNEEIYVCLLEQVKKKENRAAGIIGMVCTAASLAVFGPDNFLIPAMILLLAVLMGGRKKLCK